MSGCSTAVIAVHRLFERALCDLTSSVGRSNIGPGLDLGTDTACDSRLGSALCISNFGSSLTGVSVVILGTFLAEAGKSVCAPGMNPRSVNGSRSKASTASKVIHKTTKRVVGFSRGSSLRSSHIATASNVPSQTPLRRVVTAKLICVISSLLARSPQSSF